MRDMGSFHRYRCVEYGPEKTRVYVELFITNKETRSLELGVCFRLLVCWNVWITENIHRRRCKLPRVFWNERSL